jgi:hypothetical protein
MLPQLRVGQSYYYVINNTINSKLYLCDDLDRQLWDSHLAFADMSEAVAFLEATKTN